MPLTVKNNDPNTTVFTKTIGGDPVRIVWGPKDSPSDKQRVPNSFAEDIDFLNSLEQGLFEIVDGPEEIIKSIQVETQKGKALREEALSRASAATMEQVDRRQDKAMVGATCIGPGPAGRTTKCERPLLIAHKDVSSVPPLCPEHAHLAPNFYLSETEDPDSREGIRRREWKPIQMTAPVQQG